MEKTISTEKQPKARNNDKSKKPKPVSPSPALPEKSGTFKIIPVDQINPSPLNHRKSFSVKKMEELAVSITQKGVLQNLIARVMPSGRYRLVSGERRYKAAIMAGLTEIPVMVMDLTDADERQIQLIENLQREDPDPFETAEAIGILQSEGRSIEDIACWLGKSRAFIYSRLKLVSLIPEIREMFAAEKFTLKEVLDIVELSPDSQQEFFHKSCENWRNEGYKALNLPVTLAHYRYDLTKAPFDTQDKDLLPDAGPCTRCPFNTATRQSLFPEDEPKAVCTSRSCFQHKYSTSIENKLRAAIREHQPAAILYTGRPTEMVRKALQTVADSLQLPQYNYSGVQTVELPEPPSKEDYLYEDYESGEEKDSTENETAEKFDAEGYEAASEEYRSELEEYNRALQDEKYSKGLLVSDSGMKALLFDPEPRSQASTPDPSPSTAKEVQAAIKAGTATPELLKAEISRLDTRETRSKELDREKVHLTIHAQITKKVEETGMDLAPTAADHIAARWFVYQALGYSDRLELRERLQPGNKASKTYTSEDLYTLLSQLTPEQLAYMIRRALVSSPESKSPHNPAGYFLCKMAAGIGIDIEAIEKAQQEKATTREAKQQARIEGLNERIKTLTPKDV